MLLLGSSAKVSLNNWSMHVDHKRQYTLVGSGRLVYIHRCNRCDVEIDPQNSELFRFAVLFCSENRIVKVPLDLSLHITVENKK